MIEDTNFSKDPEINQQCGAIIQRTLASFGWSPSDGSALASKTFDTAVGEKTAFAYLTPQRDGDPYRRLLGDYWSEGRNIMASCCVLIPKTASADALRDLAEQFAMDADKTVAESYAGRLARKDRPR